MHIDTQTHTHVHTRTRVHTLTHTHTRAHTHTHTQTHTHTHTHTHQQEYKKGLEDKILDMYKGLQKENSARGREKAKEILEKLYVEVDAKVSEVYALLLNYFYISAQNS